MSDTLVPLRTAMKFSLWMWALYWPAGGLLLLAAGMTDPLSIMVALGSLAGFLLVMAAGGVQASDSRDMREFLVERPLYVIGGAILLIVVASFFDPLQNIGLMLFSGLFLFSIALLGGRLWDHVRQNKLPLRASGADQVVIALLIALFSTAMIFLDALLPLLRSGTTNSTSTLVAVVNWMNLFYPPLLLLSMRPFRDRLQSPLERFRSRRGEASAPTEPVPAEA